MRHSSIEAILFLLLAGLVAAGGCGGGSGGGDDDPGDPPPTVTIVQPATGSVFDVGQRITFIGRGTDPEDGELPETVLNWSSTIDGPFGLGGRVHKDDLSYGVHRITLRGIDSQGQFTTDTIEITILAPIKPINTAGDLVITEVQVDPGPVTGADGEWFEIYNPTDSRLDLAGLTIRDDGTDFHQIGFSTLLAPKAYFVFGRSRDTAANGGAPVDHAYLNAISLDDDVDEIVLVMGQTIIDRVDYAAPAWPYAEGIAMSLSEDALAHDLNDLPENWCQPAAVYGPFLMQGTPGGPNPICVP